MAFTNLTGPMTEGQFGLLIKLIGQAYAADAAKRAEELYAAAGYDKAAASAKIDQLKQLAKTAAPVMPAYVPPPGHYVIDGKHVHVKQPKYTSVLYVYVDDHYQGVLGKHPKAAEAVAALTDADAAYAAIVAFADYSKQHGGIAKCGVCNTKLKDPKSIAAGIGPVCAKKYGKTI